MAHSIDNSILEPFVVGDRVESFHPAHRNLIPEARIGEVVSMEYESDSSCGRIWFVWVRADNGRRFAVRPSQLAVLNSDDLRVEPLFD